MDIFKLSVVATLKGEIVCLVEVLHRCSHLLYLIMALDWNILLLVGYIVIQLVVFPGCQAKNPCHPSQTVLAIHHHLLFLAVLQWHLALPLNQTAQMASARVDETALFALRVK